MGPQISDGSVKEGLVPLPAFPTVKGTVSDLFIQLTQIVSRHRANLPVIVPVSVPNFKEPTRGITSVDPISKGSILVQESVY